MNVMCRVLDVSVSGFYAWKRRPLCPRKREDGELATRIEETFVQNRQVYGSPRIPGSSCERKAFAVGASVWSA
jgi:putative transposase